VPAAERRWGSFKLVMGQAWRGIGGQEDGWNSTARDALLDVKLVASVRN
jgi:hypothetical protein